MSLSPREAENMAEQLDDLVQEAKAVRRRSNLVVQIGARLRDQLRNSQTEEVTENARDNRTTDSTE